jgi:hypothetical protein
VRQARVVTTVRIADGDKVVLLRDAVFGTGGQYAGEGVAQREEHGGRVWAGRGCGLRRVAS